MWGKPRTRGTYSGGEAAVGGCSWWGHTGPALHLLELRPRTARGRNTHIPLVSSHLWSQALITANDLGIFCIHEN